VGERKTKGDRAEKSSIMSATRVGIEREREREREAEDRRRAIKKKRE
jgi:hypothetical protein